MSAPRPIKLPAVRCLLFLSGFSGLVFEVVWTRLVSTIVGATSVGMTCIFFVFILSLSLGSFLASGIRREGSDALRLYGWIELLIGISGYLVTIYMLGNTSRIASMVAAASWAHPLVAQLAATAILIGIPSTLMGLTLPVMLSAIRGGDAPRGQIANLYGCNVFGGACGALASGFFMIWALGVTGTAAAVLFSNALIFFASLAMASRETGCEPRAAASPEEPEASSFETSYLLLGFACGAISLCLELLWGRLAKLFLGDRTLATSSLLFIYLSCLALGSFVVNRLADRPAESRESVLARFGAILTSAAVVQVLAVWAIHRAIEMGLPNAAVGTRLALALAVMIAPVAILGLAFPFLMKCSPGVNSLPARVSGRLYASNSLGSAAGAVLGGYAVPRLVGTASGFAICAGILAVIGGACLHRGKWRVSSAIAPLGVLAGILLLLPPDFYFYDRSEQLIAAHEDEYGIQLVTRTEEDYLKVKNNRIFIAYHFGHPSTSFAQESIAYFSCLVSERCGKVLNIGTGYGITAGAFTRFAELERMKTIEVLPFVFDNQRLFASKNFGYFDDPRVERICGDGRHIMSTDAEKYDVVSVNVLDPYLPGSGGLFTIDFWREAKERLAPGGVYSQLIWGPDREMLLVGMSRVFPTLLLFRASYADAYNVVALPDTPSSLELKLTRFPTAVLASLGAGDELRGARTLAEEANEAIQKGRSFALAHQWPYPDNALHTDDRPNLEFKWSHGIEYVSSFDSLQAHEYR